MAPPEKSPVAIPAWLESLPSAPEYRPTEAEFADPIAYLLKISPSASRFGLCKIIPPLPAPSKKSTLSNLTRSFASLQVQPKSLPVPTPKPNSKRKPNKTTKNKTKPKPKPKPKTLPAPTFSTFLQQLGPTGTQKPISPSGHSYTLHQFQTNSEKFHSDYLKRVAGGESLSPLQLESLFWKESGDGDGSSTGSDKPLVVDHAWGIPGSGFSHPAGAAGKRWLSEEPENVGETEWNLRVVNRANGCPLRFVREEISGVNSPVIDLGSMFSWFAWHVEDHELYGLDYLHMGAGRSWYGVPRDARQAFEEAVRVHQYAEELNPLVTFAILGEKTTIMSPEILVESGIPCCRLVQNPGEFVVTFPGAYHSGFCHGFNCGEAVNVATPDWLNAAKEAAVRRACINQPPILSHYQLLYALALSLYSRMPMEGLVSPRSSRLKDKVKTEGKEMVKKLFIENLVINNHRLNVLLNGTSCIVLPRSQTRLQPYRDDAEEASGALRKEEKEGTSGAHSLLDQGLLLSCVACGILSFSCVAVIKPKEKTAKYLMSTDQDTLLDLFSSNGFEDHALCEGRHKERNCESGKTENGASNQRSHCRSIQASESFSGVTDNISGMNYQKEPSALDLLASTYGDTSDSDKESEESNKSSTGSPNQILNKHSACFGNESRNPKSTLENEAAFSSNSAKSNIITYQRYRNGNKMRRCDKDSTRMHVFCLEHAIEVERRLCTIGGADVMLLCHPEYPKIEAEAKTLAEELKIGFDWNHIDFKRASNQDQERIKAALEDEEAVPTNGDWAVKLGINLYFSANLCMSPQYRKERMPYNRVIHELFGRSYEGNNNSSSRKSARQKKPVIAGNWCGKNWLTNQVHPFLSLGKTSINKTSDEDLVERLCFVCSDKEKVDNIPDTIVEPSPIKTPKRKTPLRKVADDSPSPSNGMVLRRSTTNRSASFTSNISRNLNNSRKRPASMKLEKQAKERKPKKAKTGLVCDIEDCNMSFKTKKDLELHKKNICPEEGCGKKLFSHKYMNNHQKVHRDERPLECPWKGCEMRFKWSWARTEHIRVHTGDRPYICTERGCGKTFRFVSDFSRHKRKTGHSAKKRKE
ncbi:Lysine-specific demethylase [Rhynchospora pubera]|uniref:Lysine-specific demethylase n=1 Tax=Rhynchospora pubera TaxID=906938 RepID=A0AAV8DYT9_9POAL|nr:Lysine-specific demethylase [Rhynchospora pubera]